MPNAIAHNVIVDGDILYVAQYEDGVLMYDIANPAQSGPDWLLRHTSGKYAV